MASSPKIAGYEHLISMKRFDTSIERMMNRLYSMVGESRKNLSIPVMIGIDVDYNGHDNALSVLRNFLHRLREVHQKHFVRFVTDTLWAMESDNGHLFYTHDGPKEARCDIMWHIKVMSDEQVEVWLFNAGSTARTQLLTETSIKLKRFVSGVGENATEEKLVHLMHRFYGRLGQLHHIKNIEEDFHVLLVPSDENNKGYYSIPLYGMSYFDAHRKFKYILGQMEYTRRNHYDILSDKLNTEDVFWMTLLLMQENKNFGVSRKTAHDTYNLAEQLFAVHVGSFRTRQSPHDIILFHEQDTVDSYRSSMQNLDDNLHC